MTPTIRTIGTRAQLQLSKQQTNCNRIKEGRRLREQEQPRNRNDLWMTQFEREICPYCRIAARQPSIRSKPQRMKRDLLKMLHIGETCRPCTRASECTHKHSLSSPQTTARPRLLKTIPNNHQSQQQHKLPQPHPSINVQNTHLSHCSTSAFDPIKASTHET